MAKQSSTRSFGEISDNAALKFFSYLLEKKGAVVFLKEENLWAYSLSPKLEAVKGETPYRAVAAMPDFDEFSVPKENQRAVLAEYMSPLLGAMEQLKINLKHCYGLWSAEGVDRTQVGESVDGPERALWWNGAVAKHLNISPSRQQLVLYL